MPIIKGKDRQEIQRLIDEFDAAWKADVSAREVGPSRPLRFAAMFAKQLLGDAVEALGVRRPSDDDLSVWEIP